MRNPLFIITDDDYNAVGAIHKDGDRYVGVDTGGRKLFDRKDFDGAVQACKKIGRQVSSAWYGIQS